MTAIPNNSPFIRTKTVGESGKDAQRVVVDNGVDDPVNVVVLGEGSVAGVEPIYNEVNISAGATQEVINETVPAGEKFEIEVIKASGENVGVFDLLIDGNVVERQRTYYTKFNTRLGTEELRVTAGQVLKVQANNRSDTPAFFNVTVYLRRINT